MLGKRKLNQIENDDWNNFNDSESEIETVQKRVTKRSKLKDIDECKIDFKIAQESIRKKILPYHLFAMNSTVIHDIPSLFIGKWGLYPISRGSKPQKENSLSASQNSLSVFNLVEREFSFWGLEPLEMGYKPHFPIKSDGISCITVEFIANKW